jgi:hypothetical protein
VFILEHYFASELSAALHEALAMCVMAWKYQIRLQYTDVLLMNTLYLHMYSFYTSSIRSSIVTTTTLTCVSQGRLGQSVTHWWIYTNGHNAQK